MVVRLTTVTFGNIDPVVTCMCRAFSDDGEGHLVFLFPSKVRRTENKAPIFFYEGLL
jgi:hypothetical protein